MADYGADRYGYKQADMGAEVKVVRTTSPAKIVDAECRLDDIRRSREEIRALVNDLLARRNLMLEYALLKLKEEDHHGTADAAMDLRDIDAELKGLRWVLGEE